jgi:hypothetical protein
MALKLRRGTNAQRLTLTGASAPVAGELIYTTDTKQLFVGDGTTAGGNSVSAPVTSVNTQTGSVSLASDNIPEGSSNFYFTNERAQDAVAPLFTHSSHSNISFTYDDAGDKLIGTVTSPFTAEDAQDAAGAALTSGAHTGVTFAYDDFRNKINATVTASTFKTIAIDPNIYIQNITNRGAGYTRTPTAILTRAAGDTTGDFTTGAIYAFLNPVPLQTISILNGGTGYLSAPTITVVPDPLDPTYANATATCTVSGGVINSVTVVFEGTFSRCPTITVTPTNGGSGASLRAFLYPTNISRFDIAITGTGWTVAPNLVVSPGVGDVSVTTTATVVTALSPRINADQLTDTLQIVPGSDRISMVVTANKRITIDTRNTGEIAGSFAGSIPYYATTGNSIVGARGLNYTDTLGTLQIGSDIQNVDGTVRVIRNSYSASSFLMSIEQYHATGNAVTIALNRARGTQTTPTIVAAGDKLGSFTFAGHDGVRFVGSAQIAARANATATVVSGSNKLQTDLEFFTSNGTETSQSRSLTLYGLDKVAQVNGPLHLHRLTTTQRDAHTGLGANTVGYMIYNTTTNKFQGYQNTGGSALGWVDLS